MKITKNELKQIVKDCLVEILTEGVGTSMPAVNEARQATPAKRVMHSSNATRLSTNRMNTTASSALKEAIKRESGGNQVMAEILADTAANSLSTMLSSEIPGKFSPSPTGTLEKIVAATEPQALFGEEAASKWASLAFSNTHKK